MNITTFQNRSLDFFETKYSTFILFYGLAFGIDKAYSIFFPYEFLRGIPFILYASLFFLTINIEQIDWRTKFNYYSLGLIAYGVSVGIIRYFAFYQEKGYVWQPILRHSVALTFAIFIFIAFRESLKKISLENLGKIVLLTSIPFLLIGLYQQITQQKVGVYPRAVSLFSEPSYYADYLVLILAPFTLNLITKIHNMNKKELGITISYCSLWLTNLFATQSGTGILKFGCLLGIAFMFFPFQMKSKIRIGLTIVVLFTAGLYTKRGYVIALIEYAFEVYTYPETFFQYHTFYDRFFPIYAAIKNLWSLDGLIGLGFGGDYFEMTNIYPASTHAEMISQKPTLSFFNSFASKIILYFGVFGVVWITSFFIKAFKTKDFLVKTGLISVLLASLWGVSNFSLPYIWFWLALSYLDLEKTLAKS